MKKPVTFYVEEHPITGELVDDLITIELPAHNEVCSDCQGTGSTYLGWPAKDQPAFTREDLYEEGPDFLYDYMSGHYDRDCPTCKGRNVVAELDILEEDHPLYAAYVAYLDYQSEEAHFNAMCEWERKMGC